MNHSILDHEEVPNDLLLDYLKLETVTDISIDDLVKLFSRK